MESNILLDADYSVQMAQNSKTDESDNIPSLDSDDDFDVDFTDPDRKSKRNYSVIKEKIDEKVSRFFYSVDEE